jgi:hypothetical protein
MLIATFGPTTGWVGKTVSYEDGQFALEDFGPITAAHVMEYDGQGHLQWPYAGMREWVRGVAARPVDVPAFASQPALPDAGQRKALPGWAIAVIVVGVLFVLLPMAAAVAIPMFLNQSSKAHDAAAKAGVHAIAVGVQAWAVDHNGRYPDPTFVTPEGLGRYVAEWPSNPFTGAPMAQGTGRGDFGYTVLPSHIACKLIAYGDGGRIILTVQ